MKLLKCFPMKSGLSHAGSATEWKVTWHGPALRERASQTIASVSHFESAQHRHATANNGIRIMTQTAEARAA